MNNIEVVDWLVQDSLRQLLNGWEIGEYMNMEYNADYNKSFRVGETIRVPFPNKFIATRGLAYQPQPIVDRHATVTLDQNIGVHFEYDAIEEALKMPNTKERLRAKLVVPAINEIKQQFESYMAQWIYQNTPNVVGVLGTNGTDFDSVFGAARQRLTEIGCPPGGKRGMFLWPSQVRALTKSAISYFQPPDAISKMFKEGSIGRAQTFDTYESNSLYAHTCGVWAGAVTVATSSVSGATTLAVTCTTGDTFLIGDSFNVSACNEVNDGTRRSTGTLKQWVMASSVTGASSAATLPLVYSSSQGAIIGPGSPFQNCDAMPLSGATLTLFPGTTNAATVAHTGLNGFALTDYAFGLCSVPLKNPTSTEEASTIRDPNTGISISYITYFDGDTRKTKHRLDCGVFGMANFYNDRCAVRVLGGV